jgi:hypothetical protein
MKPHLLTKSSLAAVCSFMAASAAVQAQSYTPITLTSNSYGYKMVVPAGETPALNDSTTSGGVTAFVGSGTCLTCDTTFYEQTLYQYVPGRSGYNSGAPHSGETFASINNSNMLFQMPPSYSADDDLMIVSSTQYGFYLSGTLTFVTPTPATNLAILCTGGNGGATVSYTVTHASGGSETNLIVVPDWFNGGSNVAWGNNGRITIGGGFDNFNSSTNNTNAPYFYAVTIPITNANDITGIEFNWVTNGGVDNFFAVSGNASGPGWTPIPVTGFNQMTLVAATDLPFPVTATMDNGTNVLTGNNDAGNTWFEKGFYRFDTSAGLPASGSTFSSAANGNISYQLADYSNNCAVMVSSNQNVANVTPASPATYASLALLTSMGNGPGTNRLIIQHQDGVNETNEYEIFDWFQASPPNAAFVANGRVEMNSRSLQNLNSGDPKLFDVIVYLTDRTSPVTNMVIQWVSGTGHTCLLAMSGVGGSSLPPTVTSEPIPNVSLVGSNVTFSISAFGYQPLTYQWYGPVAPGTSFSPPSGLIPGATNDTLTINNVSAASDGYYYVIITDGNGLTTVNSGPNGTQGGALLNVISHPLAGNYFPAIINLNPLAYWPLNETAPAPAWPAIATNYGSLGTNANAVYSGLITLYQNGSALADGEGSSVSGDGDTSEIVLPYQSALSAVPLTMEGWFNPNAAFNNSVNAGNGEIMMSDGQPFAVNETGLWVLAGSHYNSANQKGDIELISYYGSGKHTGVTIDVTNIAAGGWYYVAATVAPNPGSNSPLTGYLTTLYINGTNAGSGVSDFAPNAGAPFKIGNRSDEPGFGTYQFAGGMADVAFYPTALSSNTIAAHYAAGINPSPSETYSNLVLSSSPSLFYPLDETTPTFPAQDTGPFAVNYGASGTNDNGVYLTGTMPGSVPGPGVEQFPGGDVAVAFNHIYWQAGGPTSAGLFSVALGLGNTGLTGYVDVPVDAYNSLDYLGPITMSAWVQATPNNGGRFSGILGKGDLSYRLSMDGSANTLSDLWHFAYDGEGDQIGTGLEGGGGDGAWHFIVGVWTGTNQLLYIDGVSNSAAAATDIPFGDAYDFVIGEAPDDTGRAFDGNIAEVAIFTRALTAAEIGSLYSVAQAAAEIIEQPVASQIIGAGTPVTFTAAAIGNPTLSYQWFVNGAPLSGSHYTGATSNTLTIAEALTNDSGSYTLVVSNSFGAATSTPSILAVLATPVVTTLFGASNTTLLDSTVVLSVTVSSLSPVTNAWFYNGTLITNGNGITGATTTSLVILSATPANNGVYQYFGTNASGVGSSSAGQLVVLPYSEPTFNSNGADWTLSSSATGPNQGVFVTNNDIQMTDLNGDETTAFFFNAPVYIGAFQATWTWTDAQLVPGTPNAPGSTADGFTFCIANDPRGPTALGTEANGAGGSGLGYVGITNSFAFAVEIYNSTDDDAPGIAFTTAGLGSAGAGFANGYDYGSTKPITLPAGDPIAFKLVYNGSILNVSLTDLSSNLTFITNFDVGSIAADVGDTNTALIGFTAATGGVSAIQYIANFEYRPLPVITASVSAGNVVLTWPTGAGIDGFTLQSATSLNGTWSTVSSPINVVNGLFQVTVGPPSGNQFFRLEAP